MFRNRVHDIEVNAKKGPFLGATCRENHEWPPPLTHLGMNVVLVRFGIGYSDSLDSVLDKRRELHATSAPTCPSTSRESQALGHPHLRSCLEQSLVLVQRGAWSRIKGSVNAEGGLRKVFEAARIAAVRVGRAKKAELLACRS
ncbi:uncharacterized protein LOC144155439 [Haemaphysalis longicornis]|uniref:Uncharacterized protein n=1 Tax=Haemaphysalis longicornis TaxID=44386 RepID=A0A9J6H6Q4_HAELO|nr:hypothetical protein HPB48_023339 [Haemaphysalis longicornis]